MGRLILAGQRLDTVAGGDTETADIVLYATVRRRNIIRQAEVGFACTGWSNTISIRPTWRGSSPMSRGATSRAKA